MAFEWSLFLVGIRVIMGSNLEPDRGHPEIYDFNPSNQTCIKILFREKLRAD
jgi:hypothetical protein